MATNRDGPNPLRPYYIPSNLKPPSDPPNTTYNLDSQSKSTNTNTIGSSARNILSDLDYADYISEASPSPPDVIKKLLEQAMWKYTSVFLAQPFEVAKTVLQVHLANGEQQRQAQECLSKSSSKTRNSHTSHDDISDDSDLDSPSYFTSGAPFSPDTVRSSRAARRRASRGSNCEGATPAHRPQPLRSESRNAYALDLKSSSAILSCVSSLWAAEGAWGLWKGTNSTFIYSLLLSTTTSFIRSFFSAFLALPDPGLSFSSSPITTTEAAAGGLDILSSPMPIVSLIVAVTASGLAGILLTPLDIARTRIILTSTSQPPRSMLSTLRSLPTWTLPSSLALTAILHSTIPTFMSASAPLFLRSKLGIDPLLNPNLYAIIIFMAQTAELAVKLPVETVLRRGQIAVAREATNGKELQTVVETGAYKGLYGTMRSIIYEEGQSYRTAELARKFKDPAGSKASRSSQGKTKTGQGVEGLWRGWRVGIWGLVGVWGAATYGGVAGQGGEF